MKIERLQLPTDLSKPAILAKTLESILELYGHPGVYKVETEQGTYTVTGDTRVSKVIKQPLPANTSSEVAVALLGDLMIAQLYVLLQVAEKARSERYEKWRQEYEAEAARLDERTAQNES